MSKYDWLKEEVGKIPRKKFHTFSTKTTQDLKEIEGIYGLLPTDYRDFVQQFGQARMFLHLQNPWYCMTVFAPPRVRQIMGPKPGRNTTVRIEVGHCLNTGDAWLLWDNGAFMQKGAVFSGLSSQRPKVIGSFEVWLTKSFHSCRKLYSKSEWEMMSKPAPEFDEREKRIVEAISKFEFKKVGVAQSGNLLVLVENKSKIVLPYLTVGARSEEGMEGTVAFNTSSIVPGTSMTIEEEVYRTTMNPHHVELFRLPVPEPEDRPYFLELK